MKLWLSIAAIGAALYLLYSYAKQSQTKAIFTTPFTPVRVPPTSFFQTPSPIIANGSLGTPGASTAKNLTTGPTYAQAGIQPDLPLTPASPSLLVPLAGSPYVAPINDVNPSIDYPGIQTYMSDPNAPDPNAMSTWG